MNLHRLLQQREREYRPLRVGLIGAGKFGSMYLSQVRRTPGMRLAAVADLQPQGAREALGRVGFGDAELAELAFVNDGRRLIERADVEIVIDATGSPAAGIAHALACCEARKSIVMVNVEADALAGPLLARKAREAGIVYSLAYGDQPALICEMVDWARACGLEVVAAGKGTKYLPDYHASTPETVWSHYGLTAEDARLGGLNPQMFNSFLDGTKSAIEMCAVANATGLAVPEGLTFPPCGVDDLPRVLRPREEGGQLAYRGQVEVISSLERDGRPVFRDLRWGVYVVLAAGSEYVERCFREYGLVTDPSGRYTAMYKPYHLIGLELGISVASVGLRGEPTGSPEAFSADVVATAKRALRAGEMLDGEGDFTVYGRLLPAAQSLQEGGAAAGAGPQGQARARRACGGQRTLERRGDRRDAAGGTVSPGNGARRCFGQPGASIVGARLQAPGTSTGRADSAESGSKGGASSAKPGASTGTAARWSMASPPPSPVSIRWTSRRLPPRSHDRSTHGRSIFLSREQALRRAGVLTTEQG